MSDREIRQRTIGGLVIAAAIGVFLVVMGGLAGGLLTSNQSTRASQLIQVNGPVKPPVSPGMAELLAIVKAKIYEVATQQANAELAKSVHLPRCELSLADINVSKCFNFVKKASFDKGGKVIESIEKGACYADCYAAYLANQAHCHIPVIGGACHGNHCRERCSGGLCSYEITIPSITGCSVLAVDSIDYVSFIAGANDSRTLNLTCVLSFSSPIVVTAHVAFGGDITILSGILGAGNDFTVKGTATNVQMQCATAVAISCKDSALSIVDASLSGLKLIGGDRIKIEASSSGTGLQSLAANGYASVASAIINDINVMWNDTINDHVLPSVRSELDAQLKQVTSNIISVPGPYCSE